VKARQRSFRSTAANGSQLHATIIETGPRNCYRCTRRAIGTVAVDGRVELGCIAHATNFCEVA
jgi:hypothetical protein